MNLIFNKVSSEIMTPENYLKLDPSEKANIERTQIIPPELGKNDFGKIEILYRIPVFRTIK